MATQEQIQAKFEELRKKCPELEEAITNLFKEREVKNDVACNVFSIMLANTLARMADTEEELDQLTRGTMMLVISRSLQKFLGDHPDIAKQIAARLQQQAGQTPQQIGEADLTNWKPVDPEIIKKNKNIN